MDRFEGARDAAAKKYTFMERPEGGAQEKADIAVDALATLIGAVNASHLRAVRWQILHTHVSSGAASAAV